MTRSFIALLWLFVCLQGCIEKSGSSVDNRDPEPDATMAGGNSGSLDGSTVVLNDAGVVINSETWTVDAKATEELRAQIREKRGWKENPFVSWDDEGTEIALAAAK